MSDDGKILLQINLSHALFRRGKLHDEYDDIEPILEAPWKTKRRNRCYKTDYYWKVSEKNFSSLDSSRLSTSSEPDTDSVISSYMRLAPEQRHFDPEDLEDCLKLPAEVTR